MPYPNQHAFRLIDPNRFIDGSFRTIEATAGVNIITGRLKSTRKMARQAIRFDRSKFSYAEASKWIKDHDLKPILSEKATVK